MAAKKVSVKKTTSKKAQLQKPAPSRRAQNSKATSLTDYFRLGESYTSLVLGVVVVIAIALLLVSLFKTRAPSSHIDAQKGTTSISTIAQQLDKVTPTSQPEVTESPTPTPTLAIPTNTPMPKVTKVPSVTPVKPNPNNSEAVTYRIKSGDDLWKIAEEQYHDGYKWVEIAKANNLTNPGIINVDNVLVLPKLSVTPEISQLNPGLPDMSKINHKIIGGTYVIMQGDDLWEIAVRAYGDGYKWTDIAKANNLTSPNLIHSGNTLKIPR